MMYDLAVIGGGSGGFGAALAAARLGIKTVLVEKAPVAGGTSTHGGVNCWEMGAGGTGIPFDVYRRLKRIPRAIAVYSFGRHGAWYQPQKEPYRFPGGEQLIDPARRYIDTLRRHGTRGLVHDQALCREIWHGLPFEPEAMSRVMLDMLEETGNCDIRINAAMENADVSHGRVNAITLDCDDTITARVFIDATGDAVLCGLAGCEFLVGQEGYDKFKEPWAPESPTDNVNGVSLIFRVTRKSRPRIDRTECSIPGGCWWAPKFPWSSINEYPNGDRNINMLPTMEGREYVQRFYGEAYRECERRVWAYWRHLQVNYEEFQHYRLCWIAPSLGVRETRRVVGEYILTQHDLLAGLGGQQLDDIVCIADHPMDTHGERQGMRGCVELNEPYGVPFRCLLPRGTTNLMVASRAASFSSIAASSCRLSRTMTQLGQAAGTAAALAITRGTRVNEVPADLLRSALRAHHVQLEWPTPLELLHHLKNEEAP